MGVGEGAVRLRRLLLPRLSFPLQLEATDTASEARLGSEQRGPVTPAANV